jgi:long-chain acyl-CoA synthetase
MSPDTPRWGRAVVMGSVDGRPCLQFEPRPASLTTLASSVERWGLRTALVQGDRRISYRQLATGIDRRAAGLAHNGVRPGDAVLLLAANSIDWIMAFWAIQHCGAVAVLGNGWWSQPDAVAAVTLTRPVVALVDDRRAPLVASAVPTLDVGDLAVPGDSVPVANRTESDAAVAIFTSGTSGAPKAAVLSHRALIANLHNKFVLRGWTPDEVDPSQPNPIRLVSTPLFHIGGLGDLLLTLLSGETIVLVEGRFDPVEVLSLIERERVRSWGAVPTMVSRLLDHPGFDDYDLSSLRSVALGGSPVAPALRARLESVLPHLHQRSSVTWGLTEACGSVTIGAGADLDDRPGCVGRPLPTVEVSTNPSDDGQGELLVRSPTVMNGFWGEPGPPTDDEGWLHTGDLGRVDSDGYVYVTGRSKDVIIRGGENVAAAQVEAWLNAQPEVAAAAVVGLAHRDLGEEVAGALLLRPGFTISEAELHERGRLALPAFAVPTRWWFSTEPLPTNDIGKTDKRRLAAIWPKEIRTTS